jgi:hypothetical protein
VIAHQLSGPSRRSTTDDANDLNRALGVGLLGAVIVGALSYVVVRPEWATPLRFAWMAAMTGFGAGLHFLVHQWLFRDVPDLYRTKRPSFTPARISGIALAAFVAAAIHAPALPRTPSVPVELLPQRVSMIDDAATTLPPVQRDWIAPVVTINPGVTIPS